MGSSFFTRELPNAWTHTAKGNLRQQTDNVAIYYKFLFRVLRSVQQLTELYATMVSMAYFSSEQNPEAFNIFRSWIHLKFRSLVTRFGIIWFSRESHLWEKMSDRFLVRGTSFKIQIISLKLYSEKSYKLKTLFL